MINKSLLSLILGFVAIPYAIAQDSSPSAITASSERIARLGAPANDDVADIKELAKRPKTNVEKVIAALHPIADSGGFAKADSSTMEHTLELIRALRYMTGGIDFCAQSKHIFGPSADEKNRKYWLSLTHKNCLSFFAVWPSRDRTYIAPVDAQINIISQWQHWYAAYGSKFDYKPLQDPAPEKWLW